MPNGQRAITEVLLGKNLESYAPGFIIASVEINNPTGSWLYVEPLRHWVPPFTLAWRRNSQWQTQTISVRFQTGPAASPSVSTGDTVIIWTYDYEQAESDGVFFSPTGVVTVDTEMPAAVLLNSDAVASPTAPAVGAFTHLWDENAGVWTRARDAVFNATQMPGTGLPVAAAATYDAATGQWQRWGHPVGDTMSQEGFAGVVEMLFDPTSGQTNRRREVNSDTIQKSGLAADVPHMVNAAITGYDRLSEPHGDGQTVAGHPGGVPMLYNGATFDRLRTPVGDAQPTGIGNAGVIPVVLNAANGFDRLRGPNGDGLVSTGFPGGIAELLNDAGTFDRQRGDATKGLRVYLKPTDLVVYAVSGANAAMVVTLPAAGAGLFHYITRLFFFRNNTNGAPIAAGAHLLTTTTNFGGRLWRIPGQMGAVGTAKVPGPGSIIDDVNETYASAMRSDVANTATTFVFPATGGVASFYEATICYYIGP